QPPLHFVGAARERLGLLLAPAHEVAARLLVPRRFPQAVAPRVAHPMRSGGVEEKAVTIEVVRPELIDVVIRSEGELLSVRAQPSILDLHGQAEIAPHVAAPSGIGAGKIRVVRTLRADEPLALHLELIALGLSARNGVIVEDQASLALARELVEKVGGT